MGPTCATVNDEAAVFAGSLLVFFFFEPREPLSSSKYFLVADWACLNQQKDRDQVIRLFWELLSYERFRYSRKKKFKYLKHIYTLAYTEDISFQRLIFQKQN